MKKILTILVSVFMIITTCNVTIHAENCNVMIGYDDRGGKGHVFINETELSTGNNSISLENDLVFTFSCSEDGFDMKDVWADVRAYKTGSDDPFYVASTYVNGEGIDKKTIFVDNGIGKFIIEKSDLNEVERMEIDFWWNEFEHFGPADDSEFSLMTNCTANDVDISFSSSYKSMKTNNMSSKYIFNKLSTGETIEVIISPKENDSISRINLNEDEYPNDQEGWGPFESLTEGKFKLIINESCQGNLFIEIESNSNGSSDLTIDNDITLSEYGDYGLVIVKSNHTLTVDTWIDVKDLIIEQNAHVVIKGGPSDNDCHGIHVKYDGIHDDGQGGTFTVGSIQIEDGGTLAYEEGTSGGFHSLEFDPGTWFSGMQINGKDGQAVSSPISSHYICTYNSNNTWDVIDEIIDEPQPKTPEELFEAFKNEVLNREWAYAYTKDTSIYDTTKKEEIIEKLAKEIFNTYVVNEFRQERAHPEFGFFDLFMDEDYGDDNHYNDKDLAVGGDRLDIDEINTRYTDFNGFTNKYINKIASMITLSETKNDEGSLNFGNQLDYYEFTFNFDNIPDNGNEFTSRVHVLENKFDFVFVYRVGDAKTYTKIRVDGNGFADTRYITIPSNANEYYVFGNGIGDEGQDLLKDGQTKKYHDALQLGVSASGFSKYYSGGGNNLGCTFIVYRDNFKGVQVNVNKTAAAWSRANWPVYALNENSSASIFYDNDSFIISTPDCAPSISEILDVNFANGTRDQNGSHIEKNDDGTFTVQFGSIFYDTINIVVTYQSGTSTMTLNRVGLYINWSGHHTDNYPIYHGTDRNSEYSSNGCSAIVYASFYYKGNSAPEKRSDLFVTLTYPNGTKETTIVSPVNDTIINDQDLQGDAKYVDDYQIWAGNSFDDMPKVEAIVYTDSGSADTFGGVQLGSGTGVSWECQDK